jgi:hypothetical protein
MESRRPQPGFLPWTSEAAGRVVVGGSDYNYEHFDEYIERGGDDEFLAFRDLLHVAERAPGFVAIRLDDGSEVAVSELWRRQPLVMEFGSFT